MNKFCIVFGVCVLNLAASAAWYWPFGEKEDDLSRPRISELMEPASLLIDAAADYAESGKVNEAVAEYRKALAELDRIEFENPDRVGTPDFATVNNKRAYVDAAIDSLLLKQAQQNAKAVSVTDTTELEKKFARLKGKDVPENAPAAAVSAERKAKLGQGVKALSEKDYEAAKQIIRDLLEEKPNDAAALNLRAAVETETGDAKAAERTLDQAIQSNPRSHYAYYNMARLFARTRGASGKTAARRYYETGRLFGGPVDKELEALLR